LLRFVYLHIKPEDLRVCMAAARECFRPSTGNLHKADFLDALADADAALRRARLARGDGASSKQRADFGLTQSTRASLHQYAQEQSDSRVEGNGRFLGVMDAVADKSTNMASVMSRGVADVLGGTPTLGPTSANVANAILGGTETTTKAMANVMSKGMRTSMADVLGGTTQLMGSKEVTVVASQRKGSKQAQPQGDSQRQMHVREVEVVE